jgi:hypothetical protein
VDIRMVMINAKNASNATSNERTLTDFCRKYFAPASNKEMETMAKLAIIAAFFNISEEFRKDINSPINRRATTMTQIVDIRVFNISSKNYS